MAVLGCIGMAIVYGLKVNLSVAIVGMINHTAIAAGEGHAIPNVSTIPSSFDDDCVEAASNASSTTEVCCCDSRVVCAHNFFGEL